MRCRWCDRRDGKEFAPSVRDRNLANVVDLEDGPVMKEIYRRSVWESGRSKERRLQWGGYFGWTHGNVYRHLRDEGKRRG